MVLWIAGAQRSSVHSHPSAARRLAGGIVASRLCRRWIQAGERPQPFSTSPVHPPGPIVPLLQAGLRTSLYDPAHQRVGGRRQEPAGKALVVHGRNPRLRLLRRGQRGEQSLREGDVFRILHAVECRLDVHA